MFNLGKGKRKGQSPVLIGNTHHIGARESQQDSFAISDVSNAELCGRKGVLGVVADGMGGLADGGQVSAVVTCAMLKYFNEIDPSGQPGLDLLNMLFAANDNVNSFLSQRERGGSTAVAVIIHDGMLYWVSVGDSRIYLVRNGAGILLNREHTYAAELDEQAAAGEITWEAAACHPKRAALTNYLGIGNLGTIERNIHPVRLLAKDRVILMSDGVFGTITEDEMHEAMSLEPQAGAIKLQQSVLGRQNPSQDNFTAVIFEYRRV